MTYRINGTRNGRSADIDDCHDDVATLDEAREWARSAIARLTVRERAGLRVWIDERNGTSVECVETVT